MTGINAAELRNVCKVRKDFKIDNVSFKLPSGTITGFVGENGAGKTTVIELILDIIKSEDRYLFSEWTTSPTEARYTRT